jgi:hypothetical protein
MKPLSAAEHTCFKGSPRSERRAAWETSAEALLCTVRSRVPWKMLLARSRCALRAGFDPRTDRTAEVAGFSALNETFFTPESLPHRRPGRAP